MVLTTVSCYLSSSNPSTLPSGSVTVATRRPGPTSAIGSFTFAPAATTSSNLASMSDTCQKATGDYEPYGPYGYFTVVSNRPAARPGSPYDWEPSTNGINLANGNKLTQFPIVSWRDKDGIVKEEAALSPGDDAIITTVGGATIKPVWGSFLTASYLKTDLAKWAKVVKDAGIKPE